MNGLFHNNDVEAQPSRSSTSAKRASKGTAADRMRQRFTLIVAMFGFAVVTLDAQATNVALPAIHHDLGGGLSGLQWIVTGYTLMFSALLLFGGSLADRIGSRNGYRTGMLVFILASAACGLSPSLPFLDRRTHCAGDRCGPVNSHLPVAYSGSLLGDRRASQGHRLLGTGWIRRCCRRASPRRSSHSGELAADLFCQLARRGRRPDCSQPCCSVNEAPRQV